VSLPFLWLMGVLHNETLLIMPLYFLGLGTFMLLIYKKFIFQTKNNHIRHVRVTNLELGDHALVDSEAEKKVLKSSPDSIALMSLLLCTYQNRSAEAEETTAHNMLGVLKIWLIPGILSFINAISQWQKLTSIPLTGTVASRQNEDVPMVWMRPT